MDVQSDVASNGNAHSKLTLPSLLDASQLRRASPSVPFSTFKRPGTRKSRRILRALQELDKTTDLEVLLTDTASVVKISQVCVFETRKSKFPYLFPPSGFGSGPGTRPLEPRCL